MDLFRPAQLLIGRRNSNSGVPPWCFCVLRSTDHPDAKPGFVSPRRFNIQIHRTIVIRMIFNKICMFSVTSSSEGRLTLIEKSRGSRIVEVLITNSYLSSSFLQWKSGDVAIDFHLLSLHNQLWYIISYLPTFHWASIQAGRVIEEVGKSKD